MNQTTHRPSREPEFRFLEAAARANRSSVGGNFIWMFLVNIVFPVCQWGVLVIMAKLGNEEMVGQFALGIAISAPVFMFANLNLRAVLATDAHRMFEFSDYLGLRIVSTIAALALVGGIAGFGGFPPVAAAVILLVAGTKAVESLSDVHYGLFQRLECMGRIGASMIVRGLLSILSMGAALWLTRDVRHGLLAMLAAWAAVLVAYDLPQARKILLKGAGGAGRQEEGLQRTAWRPVFSPARQKQLFRLSAPLGIVMMLVALKLQTPRYFIEHYLNDASLGVYSALAYMMIGITGGVEALGQAVIPRLANHFAAKDFASFFRLQSWFAGVAAAVGFGAVAAGAWVGQDLVRLLYGEPYASHTEVLQWLIIAAALNCIAVAFHLGVSACREFDIQVPMLAVTTVATIVACGLMIPREGITGAAKATAAAAAAHALLSGLVLARILARTRRRTRSAADRVVDALPG